MKKIILFLLCISMVFSLPSCTFPYFDRVISDLTSTPTTQTTTPQTTPTQTTSTPTTSGLELPPWDYTKSYQEYVNWCQENASSLPDHFVSLEQLAFLGKFNRFMTTKNSSYRYFIERGSYVIEILIGAKKGFQSKVSTEQVFSNQDLISNDLRTCTVDSKESYVSYMLTENIRYRYREGKLYDIMWAKDDAHVRLYVWNLYKPSNQLNQLLDFTVFPLTGDDIFSPLLNKETAVEAIDALHQKIFTPVEVVE